MKAGYMEAICLYMQKENFDSPLLFVYMCVTCPSSPRWDRNVPAFPGNSLFAEALDSDKSR